MVFLAAVLGMCMVSGPFIPAYAQDNDDADSFTLEEVTVTATNLGGSGTQVYDLLIYEFDALNQLYWASQSTIQRADLGALPAEESQLLLDTLGDINAEVAERTAVELLGRTKMIPTTASEPVEL